MLWSCVCQVICTNYENKILDDLPNWTVFERKILWRSRTRVLFSDFCILADLKGIHNSNTLAPFLQYLTDKFLLTIVTSHTVDSRYLELGYLEFCETRSVYLNKKCILIAFSNHNLALETFLQVQITRSAN